MSGDDREGRVSGRPKRLELGLAAGAFLIHIVISLQGVFELYLDGHQGYNAALRSGFARHYLEHGLAGTGGRSIKNPYSMQNPKQGITHWHHPIAVNLLVGGSCGLFGESEAAARAVPIAASLVSFWLIYFLVRRRYGPVAALVSSLVFALLPMQVEYGKMVNYEPLVVCFTLAALYALVCVRQRGNRWPLLLGLGAAACLACSSDWPGFLFCAAICIEAVVRPPRKLMPALVVGAVGVGLAALWWSWLDPASSGRDLAWLADFRVGSETPHGSYEKLFDRSLIRLRQYFGWLPLITAALWIVYEAARRRRVDPVVTVFVPMTVAYVLVFRQGAVHHSYFLFYLTPAVAVAAGVGAVELVRVAIELLGRSVRPVVLAVVIGLAWGGAFAVTDYLALGKVSKISYRLPTGDDATQPQPPYAAKLHHALLGQLLNSMTEPRDVLLMYRRAVDSMPFSYYLWRRVRRVGSVRMLRNGELLVVSESSISQAQQVSLAGRDPLVRTMEHLIYDLRRDDEGPAARQLEFEGESPGRWWRWLHSSV
ncbi:MAG: glycosyltransferase family 39 protein, partial [Deltaproteobacteria bacterium]|nr:glycosyltransferase family 39 protein [Deltaproteobacteria bacterium]